jgi:hypothetical protein
MIKSFSAILFGLLLCGSACSSKQADISEPDSYEACVARGNKILKIYPPRCVNEKGEHLVRPGGKKIQKY